MRARRASSLPRSSVYSLSSSSVSHRNPLTVSEPDAGQSNAIDKGLTRATGTIPAWLNSGDSYLPGTFEAIPEASPAHPEAGAFVGTAEIVSTSGVVRRLRPLIARFMEPAARRGDTIPRWLQRSVTVSDGPDRLRCGRPPGALRRTRRGRHGGGVKSRLIQQSTTGAPPGWSDPA
jgi:hypothetical protein